ncbi:hypothetical protein Taro_023033 [Colocasia esculenta]|uniref:TAFII-230 TBP-binding domain-containing protein n=1 Tax=Colocasia esculenta TaxID=4460 RepID=A0A843VD82_COLES|nr:hypothetical protein [Colocasia esculenta]
MGTDTRRPPSRFALATPLPPPRPFPFFRFPILDPSEFHFRCLISLRLLLPVVSCIPSCAAFVLFSPRLCVVETLPRRPQARQADDMDSRADSLAPRDAADEADDEDDYEDQGSGNRLLGFMFGNVDCAGDLDADYLDEDAKEHLAALADKLGPSLAGIDITKSPSNAAEASEQDYDEKAENAVDYEDIEEQYEGPEVQSGVEEDSLLLEKDYFPGDVSVASMTQKGSVFDDENYDEDDGIGNENKVPEIISDAHISPSTGTRLGFQACLKGPGAGPPYHLKKRRTRRSTRWSGCRGGRLVDPQRMINQLSIQMMFRKEQVELGREEEKGEGATAVRKTDLRPPQPSGFIN